MTRCHHCRQVVPLADQHLFDPRHVYCPACCPQCRTTDGLTAVPAVVEHGAVERAKRGHRRGTPRSWAYIGRGS